MLLPIALLMQAAAAPARASDTLVIRDVAVLPMTSPEVLEHRTILIAGTRIVAMSTPDHARIPAHARVIDGRGKFVLPGLADMHVHLTTADELPMYVGNGVLTVRDMNGSAETLGWRRDIAAGKLLGPRLIVSGTMIAGSEIPWRNKVTPKTAAEADSVVRAQKSAGYDQIKIYDGISKDVFDAAVAAAKRVGLPSSGHIPESVGFDGVLASGMTGLEHLDKTVFAATRHNLDTLLIPSIVARVKASGMWVTPTLESMIQLSRVSAGKYDSLMSRPEALAAPAPIREFWTTVTSRLKGTRTEPVGMRCNPFCEYQLRLAGALARAGVPMLAGTDLPNAVLVPGYSLHDELATMVNAGLTSYQALEAATRAPARFFHQESEWGSVAIGQRANLVLVDENPLKALAVLRDPAGVVLDGRWFERKALRTLRRAEH